MRFIDVSDPSAPRIAFSCNLEFPISDGAVQGKYAYATDGECYGEGMSGGVAVQGNYAYIACGHLDVVNISNPTAPKLAGFYRDDECLTAWRVAVSGDYIYATGEGKEGFSILRAVWADQDR